MTYFHRYTMKPTAPIVHIEVQPSGSATMTFKGFQFEGKVMKFKHPRDADAHARHMGFETIQRKTHPQYFEIIPPYSPYFENDKCAEHGGFFDDNPGKDICKTCEDWMPQEDDQSTQGSNW